MLFGAPGRPRQAVTECNRNARIATRHGGGVDLLRRPAAASRLGAGAVRLAVSGLKSTARVGTCAAAAARRKHGSGSMPTQPDDETDSPPPLTGGKYYITPAGHARFSDELRRLLRDERPKVVEIVSWAAGNGDRSENGDYLYGKKRLREIDHRVRWLTRRLENAVVVDPARQTDRERVYFGASVRYVGEDKRERTVTILGADEADFTRGEVSLLSPIARALIGARAGDVVMLRSPRGLEEIEVLAIHYPEGPA